jgi:hypothetical protein
LSTGVVLEYVGPCRGDAAGQGLVRQRIIRLQLAAGRDDDARRTHHLLSRRLADIDATPDPAITALLGRQRHPATSG